MSKQAYYRTMILLFTFICLFFAGILFIVITKDQWFLFKVSDIVLTVLLFLTFPFYGWTSYQYGKQAERNRHRARIKSVIDKYAPYISPRNKK